MRMVKTLEKIKDNAWEEGYKAGYVAALDKFRRYMHEQVEEKSFMTLDFLKKELYKEEKERM